MFKTRVLSAVIGIPILLGILFAGGIYWKGFFVILAIIALGEFFFMLKKREFNSGSVIPGYLLLLLLLIGPVYPLYLLPGTLLIIIYVVIYSVLYYPRVLIVEVAAGLFGAAYIGFLMSFAIRMADFNQSFGVMLLTLILTWSSDIGGYFGGKLWGKNKIKPVLSPNKTWEGALGSILLSVLSCTLFFQIIDIVSLSYAYALLLGVTASIMGQLGDLFVSSLKRYSGVKDSGKIIPGHGGVLDRFDSFLLVVPVVYYFYIYLF